MTETTIITADEVGAQIDNAVDARWHLFKDIKFASRKEEHPRSCVIWSASEMIDLDEAGDIGYRDILSTIAVPGKVRFVSHRNAFWGNGTDYFSEVMEDPTWLDVAVLANEMIHTTGDYHHVFLEDIQPTKHDAAGVLICEFSMGS